MRKSMTRRSFLETGTKTAAGMAALSAALGGCSTTGRIAAAPARRTLGANDRIRVGVIGVGGRGRSHISQFKKHKNAEVVAICDVDDAQIQKGLEAASAAGSRPRTCKDFREIVDAQDVDAVFITSCCHWHAIPAIAAMKAGKDVYLEKPTGHTIRESRLIVDTAKQTKSVVQVGLQQRSVPHWIHAVERIKGGELGQITAVHAWNSWNMKEMGGELGNHPDCDPPAGVDYDMWLGPAPKRPFNPARFHFTFYFHFDYSSGMVCAWGVHLFDIIMWAMGYSIKSVAMPGGIYVLKDARDTPDTAHAVFDCGRYILDYSLCHTSGWRRYDEMDHGIEFVGTNGVLQINRRGYEAFHEPNLRERKPYASEKNTSDDTLLHQRNFFDCMRSRKQTAVDAQAGHEATICGYLANISYRVGRGIRWDADNETIPGDAEAARLLTKEYRKPWHL